MADEEIDALEAGEPLNTLVAEQVLGWHLFGDSEWNDAAGLFRAYAADLGGEGQDQFRPSEYLADAWRILNNAPRGWAVGVRRRFDGMWRAEYGYHIAMAAAPELAICRVAIKAVRAIRAANLPAPGADAAASGAGGEAQP